MMNNSLPFSKVRHDNILVKLFPEEKEILSNGIYIPISTKNKHTTQLIGEIQLLGDANIEPDGERPFSVKVGDIVVIEKTAGIKYTKNSDNYLLIKESDILLILNKKELKN